MREKIASCIMIPIGILCSNFVQSTSTSTTQHHLHLLTSHGLNCSGALHVREPHGTDAFNANKIIEEKGLDIDFKAITFTTFGGFGEGTHELIKKITNDTDWNCNDPWVKPSPNSHAYLTFGFALARANARMLLHADSRRRSAKNRVRTTRPRSTTP